MRNPKIQLIDKKHANVGIYIFDDILQFKLGSKFVAVSTTDNKYELMQLEFVIENYKFPQEGEKLPMLTRFLKGLDEELFNEIEFYDGKVKVTY